MNNQDDRFFCKGCAKRGVETELWCDEPCALCADANKHLRSDRFIWRALAAAQVAAFFVVVQQLEGRAAA